MLVILEGLDNTGKTTIAKMLMQYYKIQVHQLENK